MLTEIRLLGELGRLFGRVWHLHVSNSAQAIRAIAANCPNFLEYLYKSEDKGVAYRVINNPQEPKGIDISEIEYPIMRRLIIAPIIHGSGGGFGRIILGVALIGAAFIMPASIGLFGLTLSSTAVGLLGASLVLGGITQLISPSQKTERTKDQPKTDSFLFDQATQLGDQGRCVPVGYGRKVIISPVVISSTLITQEVPIS